MKAVSQARQSASSAVQRPLWRVRSAALEVVALVVLLLAIAGGSLVARLRLPGYEVDLTVAQPPGGTLNLVGLHALEQNAQFRYHWSSGYAFVQLPSGYNAAPRYFASVRLRAANPNGPQPLTFRANEHDLATVTPDTAFRTYHLLLAHGTPEDRAVRFALATEPFSPPGDPRELGAILTGITLRPVPHMDWSIALLLPLALLALWGWLRRHASAPQGALAICGVLGATLLACYALYRPAPLGYAWLLLLVVLATGAAALLACETVTRLALAALAALMSFSGAFWPAWLSDDAFISFRYAQNLVAGNGLVYNVGERVEGYTNFLWTMLAALVLALGLDLVFWTYVAGVVLALAILLLTYGVARRLLGPAWALVAALFVATSQSLLLYTARGAGLETGLFTLLALGSSALYLRWRSGRRRSDAILSGAGFALTSLTRPEGVLLIGLTALHLVMTTDDQRRLPACAGMDDGRRNVRRRWSIVRGPLAYLLGAFLLIFLPYFLWRVSYYGDLLPNTFYAKTGGGVRQVLRGLEYAGKFALVFGGPLLLAIFVPLVRNRQAVVSDWRGYLLLLGGVYTAYIVVVGGDHFPGDRFFVPLVPWFALLMAGGLAELYAWCRMYAVVWRVAPVALALMLLVYGPYALHRSAAFNTVIAGNDESVWIWRELGWWLHDHAAPDESVAALGAGAIAYYSDRTVIDLLGLTDRHIARVAGAEMGRGTAGHEKRDPAYVLNERRPTYIPRMWDGYFGGERVLEGSYTLIEIQTRYGRKLELWKRNS